MSVKNRLPHVTTIAIVALLSNQAISNAKAPTKPWTTGGSPGLTALAAAADQDRYAFVLFWKEDDDATQQMNAVLTAATTKLRADVVSVRITDSREAETVKIFGVDRAPMPLVVAVAPNGAVTKAWPLKCTADQLAEGIVSRATAQCLKAMQAQKLTLVSVRNAKTLNNVAASQAIQGFKADERFATATEVVDIDPADAHEHGFLASLKVDPRSAEAVTLLLSPAGQPIARFAGRVTTDQLVAKVISAQAGCCPDGKCGPGGCCPGGKCGPAK